MLAYYWLLATPAMALVFGLYLYLSVCACHVHYDEAFSALRLPDFKAITRMHITTCVREDATPHRPPPPTHTHTPQPPRPAPPPTACTSLHICDCVSA